MKRPPWPYRTFGFASLYAFIAGLLASLGLNVLTSLRFVTHDKDFHSLVASGIVSLAAAAAFWCVSATLEAAKSEWAAEGSPSDRARMDDAVLRHGRALAVALTAGCLLTALSVLLLAP